MRRGRALSLLLALYLGLAGLMSLLVVKPAFYGLSTVLGTTVLGTTVLGTTVLGTTVLGTTVLGTTVLGAADLTLVYANALALGQLAISLMAVATLAFMELVDPSYGRTLGVLRELRGSYLPISLLFVVLFTLIVVFRVWEFIA